MDSCEKMLLSMSLFCDGELSKKEKDGFEAHLKSCGACKEEWARFNEMMEGLAEIPQQEVPAGLRQAVMAKIENMATPIDLITEHATIKKARPFLKRNIRFDYKKFGTVASGLVVTFLVMGFAMDMISKGFNEENIGQGGMEAAAPAAKEADVNGVNMEPEADYGAELFDMIEMDVPESAAQAPHTQAKESMTGGQTAVDAAGIEAEGLNLSVKEFHIVLEADDFERAVKAVNALEGRNDLAEITYAGERIEQRAQITRRIPLQTYEEGKRVLRDVGKVVSEYETESEITYAVMDTKARLQAKQVEMQRLRALLEKSETMDVMIAVERRLGRVETQKDDLAGQIMNYDSQAAEPAVYITIMSEENAAQAEILPLSARMKNSFAASLRVCMRLTEWMLVVVSALFPPVAVLAAAAVLYALLTGKIKRRGASGK